MITLDLTSHVFGRLTVVAKADNIGRDVAWKCLCQCGQEVVVKRANLKSGRTSSCGCFRIEMLSVRAVQRNTVHGHNLAGKGQQSPTWHSWASMRKRCLNPHHRSYSNYGGRGIKICDRWSDFRSFLDDMGERPEGKTLDRIDVDGGYEPANCRWATLSEQQKNKRSNKCSN